MSAFLLSTALIFVAELGDKSQLVALYFATRYRWWVVLAGVTVATLVVHLASVVIGRVLDDAVPRAPLEALVGLSFLGFAWWSLRGDTIDEDDQRERHVPLLGGFGVVAVAFFIAELGDKTQLATVSLAGHDSSFVGIWLGSTVGMVLADAVAVGVGIFAGEQLPHRRIAQGAAALFLVFGVITLASAFR